MNLFTWVSRLRRDSHDALRANPPCLKFGARPRRRVRWALPGRSDRRIDERSAAGGPHVGRHLKPMAGKPDNGAMRNIDFIYLINLDERPEKLFESMEQLKPYRIYPYRVSAINGWTLPIEVINDVGVPFQSTMAPNYYGTYFLESEPAGRREIMHRVGQPYFCDGFARGTLGCILSHLSVLQDACSSGYSTIWVMEDDIHVIQDPHRLSELIDELDAQVGQDHWDVLFTDVDTKNQMGDYVPCKAYALRPNFFPADSSRYGQNEKISTRLRSIGARYGAYSMIIRRSGMEKILNFVKAHGIFLPYDMDYFLPPSMHLYTVLDDVVSTNPRALSDNGTPTYHSP